MQNSIPAETILKRIWTNKSSFQTTENLEILQAFLVEFPEEVLQQNKEENQEGKIQETSFW